MGLPNRQTCLAVNMKKIIIIRRGIRSSREEKINVNDDDDDKK